MQHPNPEEISRHLETLQAVDADTFLDKQEAEVWPLVHDAVDALTRLGPAATPKLCILLETDFTWSCYYALKILRQTRDPQAIPALITLLRRETDDTVACEEAMLALQDIGEPAIAPLRHEVDVQFHAQRYNSYLVDALTGIIGHEPYEYMVNIVQDYLRNPGKYHGWFHISDFTFNFGRQQRTQALPLLRELLTLKTLDGHERQEIAETIEVLENPALYEEKLRQTIDDLASPSHTTPSP
jgi:hypothetical protein